MAHAVDCSRHLAALLRHEMLETERSRSPHAVGLQGLLAEMHQSPQRRWRREEMAARLHLSARQTSQVFRDELGASPRELLVQLRMTAAIDRLVNTRMPIKSVATSLGYESLHSFTRIFTNHVGMPPGKYRKRFGHNIAVKTRYQA